jgi:RNase adaptor protein for sRNA GlmZ degradation
MSASTQLKINLGSFSFKKGYPKDETTHGGGFVFDCRHITNPGRFDSYKSLTGKDLAVVQFLESMDETEKFFGSIESIIDAAIKRYLERQFDYLSVQFGCTGGQHRSVYFAERLKRRLEINPELEISLTHRDCPK